MVRRICVVTGSRAEYGLIQPTLKAIDNHPDLELSLIVCGMHLADDFGNTYTEIENDGFKIDAKIDSIPSEDTGRAMAESVGMITTKLSKVMERIRPDFLLALTDLGHALATAIVGVYMNIPVAHIHGGDVTGTVDEPVRHAITKLSHIHFPATKKSAERIIKMGEDKWRVHIVGAPGLDSILNQDLLGKDEILKKYRVDTDETFLLASQHPVTSESDDGAKQIKETLEAIVEMNYPTVLIYPNADAGGRRMIEVIEEYAEGYPFIKPYKSIPHQDYLSLMKAAGALVGNSSSGIIESPSFHIPVVNIGTRQEGRERSENVLDVGYSKEEIIEAISKALFDKKFKEKVRNCKNPYGDGKASDRIVEVLSNIKIDKKLIQKRLRY